MPVFCGQVLISTFYEDGFTNIGLIWNISWFLICICLLRRFIVMYSEGIYRCPAMLFDREFLVTHCLGLQNVYPVCIQIGYKPILGRRRMRQDSTRKTNSGDGTRKLVQRWYPRHVIFECLMVKRLLIEFTKFQEMAFPISASCPKLHLLFPVIKLLCSVDQGLTGWISPRDFVCRCHVSIFFDLANYVYTSVKKIVILKKNIISHIIVYFCEDYVIIPYEIQMICLQYET